MRVAPVNIAERKELGITAGDTVRVWQKIEEKGKTRLQAFEGLVLSRKHGDEPGATFTVRKVSEGVGVEKIFPLYSPVIDRIEIIKRAKVRRAKLYYVREKVAREMRRALRRMQLTHVSTKSEMEQAQKRARAEEEAQKKAEDLPAEASAQAGEAAAAEEAAKAEEAKAAAGSSPDTSGEDVSREKKKEQEAAAASEAAEESADTTPESDGEEKKGA